MDTKNVYLRVLEYQQRHCDKHGEYNSQRQRIGSFELDWSPCLKCRKEAEADERERQETDRRRRKIEALLQSAKIPPRFRECAFDNYVIETDRQTSAVRTCKEYATSFETVRQNSQCLVLSGKTGTGKTHLAIAIVRHVIRTGRSALFIGALEAIKRLRATWGQKAIETEQEVMDCYCSVDLLVLDEIGAQFGSEAEQVQMFEIINYRYMDMKPTIISSNLDAPSLERVLGQRALGRLRENGGKLVAFDWESYRGRS